jgi:hypothetical protein
MEFNEATTAVFDSAGGQVAEYESAISGTTDSAHIATAAESTEYKELL